MTAILERFIFQAGTGAVRCFRGSRARLRLVPALALAGVMINAAAAPDPLAAHIATNIQARIAGKSTNDLAPILNATGKPADWAWNTHCPWTRLRGISGLVGQRHWSVTNSGVVPHGGALVAPRFVVTSSHSGAGAGSVYYFMTTNGTAQMAVVTDWVDLAPNWRTNDCQVGMLDRDVSCEPLKVLPPDALQWLGRDWPVLGQGQDKKLWVHTVETFGGGVFLNGEISVRAAPQYTNCTRPGAVGGDSGNPICTVINDELVLVASWTTPAASRWNVSRQFHRLNAAMSNLCIRAGIPVQQLTPATLDAWPRRPNVPAERDY